MQIDQPNNGDNNYSTNNRIQIAGDLRRGTLGKHCRTRARGASDAFVAEIPCNADGDKIEYFVLGASNLEGDNRRHGRYHNQYNSTVSPESGDHYRDQVCECN